MELLFLNDQLQVMLRDKINRQLKLNDWLALILGLTGMFFSVIAVSNFDLRAKNTTNRVEGKITTKQTSS